MKVVNRVKGGYMWRKSAICLATFVVFLATSCFGEQCECEDGRYQAVYSKIDGTCGDTTFYSIPIDYRYSQIGKWELKETNFHYENQTNISYQGCVLNLTHQVRVSDSETQQEKLIFQIQGLLDIEKSTQLSGRVLRTDFSREDESPICQGNYNVVLNKIGELDVD